MAGQYSYIPVTVTPYWHAYLLWLTLHGRPVTLHPITVTAYLLTLVDTAWRTSTVTSHYGNTLLTYLLTVVDTTRRASMVTSHYGNTLLTYFGWHCMTGQYGYIIVTVTHYWLTYLLWLTLHGGPVRLHLVDTAWRTSGVWVAGCCQLCWAVGWLTLRGGSVRLHPIRATPYLLTAVHLVLFLTNIIVCGLCPPLTSVDISQVDKVFVRRSSLCAKVCFCLH